jgi:CheY-like chemotaxis protein/CHASE3 domain sensor protein
MKLLNIRNKLILGFGIISLKMIAISLFVLNEFSESNQRLNYLADSTLIRIDLANEIMIGLLQVTRFEKNIIIVDDSTQIHTHQLLLRNYADGLNRSIIKLKMITLRQEVLHEIEKNWMVYQKTLDKIIEHSNLGQNKIAFHLSDNEARASREAMIALCEDLRDYNQSNVDHSVLQSQNALKNALTIFIIMILISIVLVSILSIWIIKGIVSRIGFISKEADKIARREVETISEDHIYDELKPVNDALKSISLSFKEITENAISVASGNYETDIKPISDKDILGKAINKMSLALREVTTENKRHNWLVTGQNELNQRIRGDKDLQKLSDEILSFLIPYIHAHFGAIYILNVDQNIYELTAQYAMPNGLSIKRNFAAGEGISGQVAANGKALILSDLKEGQFRIVSSILDAVPSSIAIIPLVVEGSSIGIIETGKLELFRDDEITLLNLLSELIGISLHSAISREKIKNLLEETQSQSEELQSQSEELQSQSEELSQANAELEEQAQQLKQQQEELKVSNEELQQQYQVMEEKNKDLVKARQAIEIKSRQIELSSKYKSEFLANMSHELRTPLNSLLILAKDLSNNHQKNLTADQIESAEIIYKSGQDLLALINEVLDLAKIEAGKMILNLSENNIKDLAENISRKFIKQIEQKGLMLNITIDTDVPKTITTDIQRLEQILKNLLSNAIKFTENGSISIHFKMHSEDQLAIAVADTGIGISANKQEIIFEAFQQAEGGTSRKYGGTGLGLSISKELAKLLGGTIKLKSKEANGSVFTLIIPTQLNIEKIIQEEQKSKTGNTRKTTPENSKYLNYQSIEDDRLIITKNDRTVLIIEDDPNFSKILKNQIHDRGFKCLAAATGEDGLLLASKYIPDAIILDITLPGIEGDEVLTELKNNPAVRHIPVHIISGKEKQIEMIQEGAIEYLKKPITKEQLDQAFTKIEDMLDREPKNLLIIEDDENMRHSIKKLIGNNVNFLEAASGKAAMEILKKEYVDCIILDLGLPDMSGFELIDKLKDLKDFLIPPIIVNTGKELTREESEELENITKSIIIKGAKSAERLLDETALFLHHTISKMPIEKQQIISALYDKETALRGKKILLVDDDMRNVFALSKVLTERELIVLKAENGKKAIEKLLANKDIDLVLMDIMMPEMDGYEAMSRIRKIEAFKDLPIIALTAKAMKDDRKKAIDSGANDYVTKPVDLDRLFSLMRIWLSKK